jgi:hypothetical protein
MTSAGNVLCSIAVESFGTPPRSARLEARQLPCGFGMWLWNERRGPDLNHVASFDATCSARAFARVILDLRIGDQLVADHPVSSIPSNAWRAATVTGERGLNAHLLRLACTLGAGETYWLMDQSRASFEFLDGLIGDAPSDEWKRPFIDIVSDAWRLGYDLDILSLLNRYRLPAVATSLK